MTSQITPQRVQQTYAQPYAVMVDAILDDFFRRAIDRSSSYGADYTELWASLQRASQGGKRFRPALLTGIYQHLGGTDETLACTVAAAVELLHTAFVVHDDVIDHDELRRGRLNVTGTFAQSVRTAGGDPDRAATLGAAAGILAGDLALTGAHRLVASSTAAPTTREELLSLLDHAIYVTAAGELSDVRNSLGPVSASLTEVIDMAANKTAVYSFELPLQAGAVLAGASRETVEGLGRVGRLVGTAFQLQDDLDGVFGDEAVTGKNALTDLREGKVTPLVVHASGTSQWPFVRRHLGDAELTLDQLYAVRAALESSGSRAFIAGLAAEHLGSARRLASQIDLPAGADTWLRSAFGDLMWRSA
ncbi:polyprenyl synthetase family protein [Sanguibacter suarezii]|uniref:polyprenyl synthetase family protein n=1 Tax=Sanguibacter suarezii TaxID=60921 RepID=UPI00082A995E|nr:polyprenyl synthetase family protein [Sanguibacter suarezii]